MEKFDALIVNVRLRREPPGHGVNIGRPGQMAGVMGSGRTAMERLSKAATAAGFAMATEDDQPAPLARPGDMVVAPAGTAIAVRTTPEAQAQGWSATLREWLPTSLTRNATA